MISVSVVNPLMLEQGWTFDPGAGVVPAGPEIDFDAPHGRERMTVTA